MRFIATLLGRFSFCIGLMITIVGCVVGSVIGSTSRTAMSGIILMILGGWVYWYSSTRVCSQCSKRIKHEALECKYCGGVQA